MLPSEWDSGWLNNTTCACRISALDHEFLDDSMELETIVVATARQLGEVAARHWCVFPVHLQLYCTHPATSFQLQHVTGACFQYISSSIVPILQHRFIFHLGLKIAF